MFSAPDIATQLVEGDEELDAKDIWDLDTHWTAKILWDTIDNPKGQWVAQFFLGDQAFGMSNGSQHKPAITKFVNRWLPLFNVKQSRIPFNPPSDTSVWTWFSGPNGYKDFTVTESKDANNVKKLVADLTEGDDDADDMKELSPSVLTSVTNALKDAGFTVGTASQLGDEALLIEFSWPGDNVTALVNGAKRAKEVLKQYLDLRPSDWKTARWQVNGKHMARMVVRKRILGYPSLWSYKRQDGMQDQARLDQEMIAAMPAFYDFLFSGHKVGEAYCVQGDSTADRIRAEMIELHALTPFDPARYADSASNAWCNGPVFAWWRQNRSQLGDLARSNDLFINPRMVNF